MTLEYRLLRFQYYTLGATLKEFLLDVAPHKVPEAMSVEDWMVRYRKPARMNKTCLENYEQDYTANGYVYMVHWDTVLGYEIFYFGENNPDVSVLPKLDHFYKVHHRSILDKIETDGYGWSDEGLYQCLGACAMYMFEVGLLLSRERNKYGSANS